jgi:uncharacterized protein (DUF433 family)/predicted nuclease of predicted toxin-antitoxin system
MSSLERITITPDVRFGKPCIRGTRISVGDVLGYLAGGMSEDQILADFPQLTREDIRACLAYAAERERRTMGIPAAWVRAPALRRTVARGVGDGGTRSLSDSLHVRLLGKGGAADHIIWELAREHGCVLVTKDEDFHRLSVLRGAPPKVVWLRIGNCATADIARLLRDRVDELRRFEAQGEVTLLELG